MLGRWYRASTFRPQDCVWGCVPDVSPDLLDNCFFAVRSHSTLIVDHLSKGPMWSYWCPLTWNHFHWICDVSSLESMAESKSKLLDLQENVVSWFIVILMSSGPSQATVVYPSRTLHLLEIISTIIMTWRIPEILLLHAFWYLGYPDMVLVTVILWVEYCWPSMMSSTVPYCSFNYPSLTKIAVSPWISISMYLSEVILAR